jgi:predicted enzyme related to lactoylglutathione lyase
MAHTRHHSFDYVDLDATYAAVRAAGGTIDEEPFEFPGGRRFHFSDPAGNALAVWQQS